MDQTVSVTGHGSAAVVPDLAVVRVAATSRATNVADAFAAVSAAVATIGTTAREFTEPRRIASRDLNVWPSHDMNGRPNGFEARHAVEIGCPDLVVAGRLLSALVDAVGDRLAVEGVSLQVAEPAGPAREAREAAYADALARAQHLASLADATLGPIVSVAEAGGPVVPMEAARAMTARDASFEPGETNIGAALAVTWQLQL